MKRPTLPYQLAMGQRQPSPDKPQGPPTGADLDRYLAEVEARVSLRLYDSMEKKPKARHINCDGYDPYEW